MVNVSDKIGRGGLYFLLLAGPVLGLATKGFAPLLAVSGAMAFIAILMQPKKLKQIDLRNFLFALPILSYMGFSLIWSQAENGGGSYIILILVIVFTACLFISFRNLPIDEQEKFKNLLSFSLLFGILTSIVIGSYPLFWPDLSTTMSEASARLTFANIELLRQSNRSLALIPLFLFPLAGFYWHKAKWFFLPLVATTFFVTANSNSQTAFLAMLLGTNVFALAYFYKNDCKRLIFAAATIGLFVSPLVFSKSFEQEWVTNYSPTLIQQKASGNYREWIYFVYAKEALTRPVLGHGFESTHRFAPDNLNDYVDLARERKIYPAVDHSTHFGTVAAHAHNLPLQIILEFGYFGAFLLLAAFWALLDMKFIRNGRASRAASLGAVIGLLLFSHSIWQSWLLASLGLFLFYILVLYGRNDTTKNI